MKSLVCFCLIFGLLYEKSIADDGLSHELASRLRAVMENAAAWRSYDILVKHDSFTDSPLKDESIRSYTSVSRFAVDWDKNEFCAFVKVDYDWDHGTRKPNSNPLSNKMVARSLAYQNGGVYGKIFPDRVERFREGLGILDHLQNSWMVDIRSFGTLIAAEDFKGPKEGFDLRLRDSGLPRDTSNSQGKITISRTDGQINYTAIISDGRVNYSFVFDEKTLMTSQIYQLVQEGGGTTRVPYGSSSFSWQEKDGIFVPATVASERPEESGAGKHTRYDTYEIHWISLNEPIDQSLFNKADIGSLDALTKRIDASRLGAEWQGISAKPTAR